MRDHPTRSRTMPLRSPHLTLEPPMIYEPPPRIRFTLDGFEFSDLGLGVDAAGIVFYDEGVLDAILCDKEIPPTDNMEKLRFMFIVGWYRRHRARGGTLDPVMEVILAAADGDPPDGMPRLY